MYTYKYRYTLHQRRLRRDFLVCLFAPSLLLAELALYLAGADRDLPMIICWFGAVLILIPALFVARSVTRFIDDRHSEPELPEPEATPERIAARAELERLNDRTRDALRAGQKEEAIRLREEARFLVKRTRLFELPEWDFVESPRLLATKPVVQRSSEDRNKGRMAILFSFVLSLGVSWEFDLSRDRNDGSIYGAPVMLSPNEGHNSLVDALVSALTPLGMGISYFVASSLDWPNPFGFCLAAILPLLPIQLKLYNRFSRE